MKKLSHEYITKKIGLGSIIFLLIFFVLGVNFVSAGSTVISGLEETVSEGLLGGATVSESSLTSAGVVSSLPKAIGKVIGAGLSFLGIIFLILMIYGGFTWMLARGNEQEVEKAKKVIEAAAIGLIIVLSAFAITTYIGGSLT